MVYVPLGIFFVSLAQNELISAYSHPYINETESGLAHGCSPWGTSTIAGGKGERQPTEGELEVAVHQGKVCCLGMLEERAEV